jgi:hypothetical protein
MPLVPRFGIYHMPVSMDIEEKAIPRDADYPSKWIPGHIGVFHSRSWPLS